MRNGRLFPDCLRQGWPFLIGLWFIWNSCNPAGEHPLTIAAAANLQPVMEPLRDWYDSLHHQEIKLIFNASGKITTQIVHGAPYDVFLSADMHYPEQLTIAGLTTAPPQIYTKGQLVLWSMRSQPIPSLKALTDPSVHHVALANPEAAPYGRAAIEVIRGLGLEDSLARKLVYGESVGQATQFVQSGAADLGFTSGSFRHAPSIPASAQWLVIPDSLYAPIEQGAVIIRHQNRIHPQATAFMSFLTSPPCQEIFRKYGYLPVGNE